jgi:hypothetical protein
LVLGISEERILKPLEREILEELFIEISEQS